MKALNFSLWGVVFATVVMGASLPRPAEAHTASYANACSKVPDAPGLSVSFKHACNHHDMCYRAQSGFRHCNNVFWHEMMQACERVWWRRPACWQAAQAYWTGVYAFGGFRY